MGASVEKCEVCKAELPKNNKLEHVRKCKEEHMKKFTHKTCQKCKVLLPNEEFEDHMLCHTLEETSSNNNNVNQVTINYINNRNNISSQNNYFSNNSESRVQALSNQINNLSRAASGLNTLNRIRSNRISTATNVTNELNNLNELGELERRNSDRYGRRSSRYERDDTNIRNISVLRNLLRNLSQSLNDMRLNEGQGTGNEVISLLPESVIEDPLKLPEEKRNCVICMCQYEKGDKILTIPCCHLYHGECIKDWLKSNTTCPICKYRVDQMGMQ